MKTSVCFVNTLTEDGRQKTVEIRDEHQNLKYNFLIKLAKDDALIWDKQAENAFIEIAVEYKRLRNASKHR